MSSMRITNQRYNVSSNGYTIHLSIHLYADPNREMLNSKWSLDIQERKDLLEILTLAKINKVFTVESVKSSFVGNPCFIKCFKRITKKEFNKISINRRHFYE